MAAPALPARHPDEDVLVDFATGQLDPAQRVLLEAHLAHCPSCTESVASLTDLGARALAAAGAPAPPRGVWERLSARLGEVAADPLAGLPVPAAARQELPPLDGPPRWAKLPFTGGRMTRLWSAAARAPVDRADLLLLSFPPGRRFPRHLHLGGEEVVVLAGGYRDDLGVFEPGDFAIYPAGSEHGPTTEEEGPCWILTRIVGGVRFFGWRGLLQRLYEART